MTNLFTLKEAAGIIGIHERTLYKEAQAGAIGTKKVSRTLYTTRADIDAFMEKREARRTKKNQAKPGSISKEVIARAEANIRAKGQLTAEDIRNGKYLNCNKTVTEDDENGTGV